MKLIQQQKIPAWQPFVFFDKEFSKEECETIVHLAKGIKPEPAKTGSAAKPSQDPAIRITELRWMNVEKSNEWIFDRLEGVVNKVRESWYPFHLSGFAEPLQLTHYHASEGAHYDWHQDFGAEATSTRKLSLVVLLSDEKDFTGGELEVLAIGGEDKKVKNLSQGTVIAFPSWEFHRVLRLTQGERWSLVTWVHGHPFS